MRVIEVVTQLSAVQHFIWFPYQFVMLWLMLWLYLYLVLIALSRSRAVQESNERWENKNTFNSVETKRAPDIDDIVVA